MEKEHLLKTFLSPNWTTTDGSSTLRYYRVGQVTHAIQLSLTKVEKHKRRPRVHFVNRLRVGELLSCVQEVCNTQPITPWLIAPASGAGRNGFLRSLTLERESCPRPLSTSGTGGPSCFCWPRLTYRVVLPWEQERCGNSLTGINKEYHIPSRSAFSALSAMPYRLDKHCTRCDA